MRTTTRQRLVEAAVHRIYRDGFRSVGIDQALTDGGISKTALCLVMEGAYVTRQVTGNKDTVNIARRIAQLVIASRCAVA